MKIWDGLKQIEDRDYRDPILGHHREISPHDWWSKTVSIVLGSEPWRWGLMGTGKTFSVRFRDIEDRCLKLLKKKVYVAYAAFKHKKKSDDDVLYPIQRVIDLDAPGTVATEQQFLKVSRMFPGAYLIWANGIQIFLDPTTLPLEEEAYRLAAIGEQAQKATGLKYDNHHVTSHGAAKKFQNHPYRTPWGWASRANRPVRCFEPVGDQWSVLDVPIIITSVPVQALPVISKRGVTFRTKSRPISQGEKYDEFCQILKARRDLLLTGITTVEAQQQVLRMTWAHHSAREIGRVFSDPKYVPWILGSGGTGKFLSPKELQGMLRDQEKLGFQIGPASKKRLKLQSGWQLYKQRAWSFEWLYYFVDPFGLTFEEAVQAFLQWTEFRDVRKRSLGAIGMEMMLKDLDRLWNKFLNREGLVSPHIIQAVRAAADKLGSFKRTTLAKHVPEAKSRRHLQRALKQLADCGVLKMIGKNKGATWHVVSEAIKRPQLK